MKRDEFELTRKTITVWALGGVAVSAVGLLLLEVQKEDIALWLYAPATNVLAVLFGIAAVSMFWEYFVRRSHSQDLLRYLNLGTSVAQSGLTRVSTRSALDWPTLLATANEVIVLTEDIEWLERNHYTLRDQAQNRIVKATIAIPALGGLYARRQAELRGIEPDERDRRIQESIDRVARAWREDVKAGRLRSGSRLTVVGHGYESGYEIFIVDRTTIVTLSAPGDGAGLVDRLALVFDQSNEMLPSSFLRRHVADLETMTKIQEVGE